MKKRVIPSREKMERQSQLFPEINPSAVIAMLRILEAAAEIQHAIFDVLEREYQLSEGKLCVMLVLHYEAGGLTPSQLAERAGVTRATISAMLHRLERDGLVYALADATDGRVKKVCLSETGRSFMDTVLPGHYLRITKLMRRLSIEEQDELIVLLKKIVDE